MHFITHALVSQLGDQTACFSTVAGSTHIVDALPAAVLCYIEEHPGAGTEAVCTFLDGEVGETVPRTTVETVLQQLLDVRLIGLGSSDNIECR
ncbi:MAG: hypothetical protein AAGI72_11775 [Pseudomonadota bacterium]